MLAAGLALAAWLRAGPAAAQDQAPRTLAWDVRLNLGADSTITVQEQQTIAFGSQPIQVGTRAIPGLALDAVGNVAVAEGGTPYTFDEAQVPGTYYARVEGTIYRVDWVFFSPAQDETRTFTLDYSVLGPLEVESGVDIRFFWDAVPAGHPDLIEQATVTVQLPPQAVLVEGRYGPAAYGHPAQISVSEGGGVITFSAQDIPPAASLGVEVYFRLAEGAAEVAQAQPPVDRFVGVNLYFLGFGLLALIGLGVGLLLYQRKK